MRRKAKDETLERVVAVIEAVMGPLGHDQKQRNAQFDGDLGMESLDLVELVMELEERSGKSIPDETAESWKSVGDIAQWAEEAWTPVTSAAS